MVEAVMIWNEPNNLSHWDFHIDRDWKIFAEMAIASAQAVRRANPDVKIALGGISPIDANFIQLMKSYGVLDAIDIVALHGFPLDWNHWSIHEWPQKLDEIRAITERPIWVSEVGASSFGAEEVQAFGLEKTAQYLLPRLDRVFWYSLLDLPATWTATTRHKESEGSAYYRHYYMGLVREDGRPKLAAANFPREMGICQWFHFEDPRFELALEWLRRLKVRYLRTGISWADWFRQNSHEWFDHQMRQLEPFDTTLTLCFTPEHLGLAPHYTSPPKNVNDFVDFTTWAVERYVPRRAAAPVASGAGEKAGFVGAAQ